MNCFNTLGFHSSWIENWFGQVDDTKCGKIIQWVVDIWATFVVFAFLLAKYGEFEVHWDLIAKKAKKWLSKDIKSQQVDSIHLCTLFYHARYWLGIQINWIYQKSQSVTSKSIAIYCVRNILFLQNSKQQMKLLENCIGCNSDSELLRSRSVISFYSVKEICTSVPWESLAPTLIRSTPLVPANTIGCTIPSRILLEEQGEIGWKERDWLELSSFTF